MADTWRWSVKAARALKSTLNANGAVSCWKSTRKGSGVRAGAERVRSVRTTAGRAPYRPVVVGCSVQALQRAHLDGASPCVRRASRVRAWHRDGARGADATDNCCDGHAACWGLSYLTSRCLSLHKYLLDDDEQRAARQRDARIIHDSSLMIIIDVVVYTQQCCKENATSVFFTHKTHNI